MKNLISSIVLASIFILTSCGDKEDIPLTPESEFKLAKMLYDDDMYSQALNHIEEAFKSDTTNADWIELRGLIHGHLMDTMEMEHDFQHAIRLDTSDHQLDDHYRELIKFDVAMGRNDEAHAIIEKELALYTNEPEKHKQVIDFAIRELMEMDDEAGAMKLCKTTIKEFPHYAMPHERLGHIELDKKHYSKAASHFRHYVKIDDKNTYVLSSLGYCYLQVKNKSKAKKYYKMAADLGDSDACNDYRELSAKTRYSHCTLCCDNSTSQSSGRGTCSHHGGVCGIKSTPYKEYTYECK